MSYKKLARILEVITSPATGEIFIAPVCGTLETVILDGRWNHHTTWKKVTDAIKTKSKNKNAFHPAKEFDTLSFARVYCFLLVKRNGLFYWNCSW